MNISEITINTLKNAGWYQGRNIDIRTIEESLEKIGYVIFPKAREFFGEFGNLIIEDNKNSEIHNTSFRFSRAGGFREIEKYAGERLIPVGLIDSDFLVLLISESGRFYCESGKMGENTMDCWENLLNGNGVTA